VNASLEVTFEALLSRWPGNETMTDPLPMKIEPWPAADVPRPGRQQWSLLGHVQAIKRPTLLEITGPCLPRILVSNLQYA